MNGALTTLKWMLMIIQLFTMAHLFLDGLPGLPIKFSSSPWAPKTWARIHLLWPVQVQVGSTHFFTWHLNISMWILEAPNTEKMGFSWAFHLDFCCKIWIWIGKISMVSWWKLQRGPGGLNDKTSAGTRFENHCCDLHPETGQELPDFAGKPHGSCFQTKADHFGVLLPMDKSVNQDLVEESYWKVLKNDMRKLRWKTTEVWDRLGWSDEKIQEV